MRNRRPNEPPWYCWHMVTCLLVALSASVFAWAQAGIVTDSGMIQCGWPLRFNYVSPWGAWGNNVGEFLPWALVLNIGVSTVLVMAVGACAEFALRRLHSRMQYSLGILISLVIAVAVLLGDYESNTGVRLAQEFDLEPVTLFRDVPILPSAVIYLSIFCAIYFLVSSCLQLLGWLYPICARHPRPTTIVGSCIGLLLATVLGAVYLEAARQRAVISTLRDSGALVVIEEASSFTHSSRDLYLCSRVTSISRMKQPSDEIDFGEFSRLERLVIGDSEISTIAFLTTSTNLKYLSVDANVSDISPLANSMRIETLYLTENPIVDIGPLRRLSELRKLSLAGTQVADLSPLSTLVKLEELHLHNTEVIDVSPLAELKQLRRLDLSGTNVSDISPLAELSRLEYLNISETQVADIWPLYGMPSLRAIDIRRTPIPPDSCQEFRTAMPQCSVNGRAPWSDD